MRICDGCGAVLVRGALRYTVSIEVKAAYDTMEISLLDLLRDHRAELEQLTERMHHAQARELEDQVYKHLTLDLCPSCQRRFIRTPLGFSTTSPAAADSDMESFLRSLGYGISEDPKIDD